MRKCLAKPANSSGLSWHLWSEWCFLDRVCIYVSRACSRQVTPMWALFNLTASQRVVCYPLWLSTRLWWIKQLFGRSWISQWQFLRLTLPINLILVMPVRLTKLLVITVHLLWLWRYWSSSREWGTLIKRTLIKRFYFKECQGIHTNVWT